MNKFDQWDEQFVATALDKRQRHVKIKRLARQRMMLCILFGAIVMLLAFSIINGQKTGEIQNDRLLIMLLLLSILYKTESDIRLLKIVEAFRMETAENMDGKE